MLIHITQAQRAAPHPPCQEAVATNMGLKARNTATLRLDQNDQIRHENHTTTFHPISMLLIFKGIVWECLGRLTS